jgi:hypothetical protein
MGELLDEARVEFMRWHFEQIGSTLVLLMLHRAYSIVGTERQRGRKHIRGYQQKSN